MFSLAGRLAVITGGGTGIGTGIALEMARAGAGLVLAGRRRAKLEEARGRGGKVIGTALTQQEPDSQQKENHCGKGISVKLWEASKQRMRCTIVALPPAVCSYALLSPPPRNCHASSSDSRTVGQTAGGSFLHGSNASTPPHQ